MRRWQVGIGLGLLLALSWGLGGSAEAGSSDGPRLVHDFFPGEFVPDDSLKQLTQLGGTAFFIVQDLEAMPRVWRTDGTPEGTRQAVIPGVSVADADRQEIEGTVGRYLLWTSGDLLLSSAEAGDGVVLYSHARTGGSAILAGRYFFHGCGMPERCTVWSTDGTIVGTKPIQTVAGRFSAESPQIVGTLANRWLLLAAGQALFAYDVRNDQVLLLFPKGARQAERFPVGETLYLRTRHKDGDRFRETLWASRLDAPRAKRIFEDPGISIAGQRDGRLYFSNAKGRLWSTDGRPGGLRSYVGTRIDPYSFSGLVDQLGAVQSSKTLIPMPGYYFGALLSADEARGEVSVVKTFCRGKYPCLGLRMSPVTLAGGKAFEAISGELWKSDGTLEGTKVHEILGNVDVSTFRVHQDRLLLGATSRQGEEQLWETDGTASGTRALSDGTPDRPFRVQGAPMPLGSKLLVVAERIPLGKQLWSVENGHATPLTSVRHLGVGGAPSTAYALGERLVSVSDPYSLGIQDDGSVETLPVNLPSCGGPFSCPIRPVNVGQRLVFPFNGGVVEQGLGFTDGTAAGSGTIPLISPETSPGWPFLTSGPLGDKALVLNQVGDLWAGDGTVAGTRWITRIPTPDNPVSIAAAGSPIALGSRTFFFRDVPVTPDLKRGNLEVWLTDGTAAGTLLLAAIPFARDFSAINLNPFISKGRLFFRFRGKIWMSDGSAAGTRLLPNPPSGYVFGLAGGTEILFAATFEGDEGPEKLWAVDLTTLAATPLSNFTSILPDVDDNLGSVLDDALVFWTADENWVYQYWVSDGTPAGTRPLPDARARSRGGEFVTADGQRYFTLCGRALGCELWTMDRLGNDVRLVADLWPGPRGSYPHILTVGEDALWFSATEPSVGGEIWKLEF